MKKSKKSNLEGWANIILTEKKPILPKRERKPQKGGLDKALSDLDGYFFRHKGKTPTFVNRKVILKWCIMDTDGTPWTIYFEDTKKACIDFFLCDQSPEEFAASWEFAKKAGYSVKRVALVWEEEE